MNHAVVKLAKQCKEAFDLVYQVDISGLVTELKKADILLKHAAEKVKDRDVNWVLRRVEFALKKAELRGRLPAS